MDLALLSGRFLKPSSFLLSSALNLTHFNFMFKPLNLDQHPEKPWQRVILPDTCL
jgi:hypothetical protein